MTCPWCQSSIALPADADFCPRCGMGGLVDDRAAAPRQVLNVQNTTIEVGPRLAVGDRCNLYAATITAGKTPRQGVFKIARDAASDQAVVRVVEKLNGLTHADARLRPFVPAVVSTLTYRADAQPPRQAVALAYDDGIASPWPLYSLEEVQRHYRTGVDARDMAWVWRRLLTALLHTHAAGVGHGNVTPAHVLIEPAGHKLVLIGWGGGRTAAYAPWFEGALPASPAVDLRTGARTMLALLGRHLPQPAPVEPAIVRHLDRVTAAAAGANAGEILQDFDRLIEALWGPRRFRPFDMPPRTGPG